MLLKRRRGLRQILYELQFLSAQLIVIHIDDVF
jgi:hypothetical protein